MLYQMAGRLIVQNVPAVNAIVDRFNDVGTGDLMAVIEKGKDPLIAHIDFDVAMECDHNTASELEEIAMELSPFVPELDYITTACDGNVKRLYIGLPERGTETDSHCTEKEIESTTAREEIEWLSTYLTADDALKIVANLIPRVGPLGLSTVEDSIQEAKEVFAYFDSVGPAEFERLVDNFVALNEGGDDLEDDEDDGDEDE